MRAACGHDDKGLGEENDSGLGLEVVLDDDHEDRGLDETGDSGFALEVVTHGGRKGCGYRDGSALWSGTNKNRDVSTGPLARLESESLMSQNDLVLSHSAAMTGIGGR